MATQQKNNDAKKQNLNDDADREINGQGMSTTVQQNEKLEQMNADQQNEDQDDQKDEDQEDIQDRKDSRSPADRKLGNQNNESEDPEVQV